MSKVKIVVSCPIDCYAGYGARSRDFVKALLKLKQYDVQVLAQRWGNTRTGYLQDHGEDLLQSVIVPAMSQKPDVWIQITVPNEFQKVGTYNIGMTAGIETTMCAPGWVEGCNRMDLVIVSSEHAKAVFESSTFTKTDNRTGAAVAEISLKTPIEVLFEGVDLTKYLKIPSSKNTLDLREVRENFCYLTVGHWLPGSFGEDRKNIGYTIKSFLETFKNKPNTPALLLKVQRAGSSIQDQEVILTHIDQIRRTVKGKLPNVYLIHGEMSDQEVNELYNHPKVKAMVLLTKGEGFGRPLLEFTVATGKPVITTGWSGQMDFLTPEGAALVGGTLETVHPSAAVPDVLLPEARWIKPNDGEVGSAFKNVFKKYKNYLETSRELGAKNTVKFSLEAMKELTEKLLEKYIPDFPEQVELVLPALHIPQLTKITEKDDR